MSIATITAPARRRGRPKASATQRLKHIQCATLLMGGQFTAPELARLFGICRKTVYNWRDLALAYDEPEAEALRRIHSHDAGR